MNSVENCLATWRLVRLVRTDSITEEARSRLLLAAGFAPKLRILTKLIDCPYCLSVWAAGVVLLLRALRLHWLVRLLAASAVAGELAARLDHE